MARTTNCNLYIENGNKTKFIDWRNEMGGTNNSNMVRIDNKFGDINTELGKKAALSKIVTEVLGKTAWQNNSAPYTQTLPVSGLGASQNGTIGLAQSASLTQRKAAMNAMLSISAQNDGVLTISADGIKPTEDIPVAIILLG